MHPCGNFCIREINGAADYDSDPVADDEWVCRTARPKDLGAKGVIKTGFFHAKPFKLGEMSAWRISSSADLQTLADKIAETTAGRPENIIAVQARDLRAIRKTDGTRAVCVINDTRIDDAGGHDMQHVALSPCSSLLPWPENDYDAEAVFTLIREKIIVAFRAAETSLHAF